MFGQTTSASCAESAGFIATRACSRGCSCPVGFMSSKRARKLSNRGDVVKDLVRRNRRDEKCGAGSVLKTLHDPEVVGAGVKWR